MPPRAGERQLLRPRAGDRRLLLPRAHRRDLLPPRASDRAPRSDAHCLEAGRPQEERPRLQDPYAPNNDVREPPERIHPAFPRRSQHPQCKVVAATPPLRMRQALPMQVRVRGIERLRLMVGRLIVLGRLIMRGRLIVLGRLRLFVCRLAHLAENGQLARAVRAAVMAAAFQLLDSLDGGGGGDGIDASLRAASVVRMRRCRVALSRV